MGSLQEADAKSREWRCTWYSQLNWATTWDIASKGEEKKPQDLKKKPLFFKQSILGTTLSLREAMATLFAAADSTFSLSFLIPL